LSEPGQVIGGPPSVSESSLGSVMISFCTVVQPHCDRSSEASLRANAAGGFERIYHNAAVFMSLPAHAALDLANLVGPGTRHCRSLRLSRRQVASIDHQ
jgi:hypothetical protein